MKQYGKKPEELEILRDGLLEFLDDIETIEITKGLKYYIKTNNDIPTPKDLRDSILDMRLNEEIELTPKRKAEIREWKDKMGIL